MNVPMLNRMLNPQNAERICKFAMAACTNDWKKISPGFLRDLLKLMQQVKISPVGINKGD